MFFIKIVNKKDQDDIVNNRKINTLEAAQLAYNQITTTATLEKEKIIREANEMLGQNELTYKDVIIYLLEDEEIIMKFLIN